MNKYTIKDFSHLVKDESGNDIKIGEISTKAFAMHLKLYEGYVNNTNAILEKLSSAESTVKVGTPEWNELNRRFGWEWNGMRNHELFFESLSPNSPTTSVPEFFLPFKDQFEAMCKIRGIGWAMLVQDKRTKQLMNVWVNEHDAGMLSDVNIILNFDMFEHAFISDFGTDRQKYLDSLWGHVKWGVVASRLI